MLFLIHRLTYKNHGHMLFDVVIPIIWATQMHNRSLFHETIQVSFVDDHERDSMDDRLRIVSPRLTPVYRSDHPIGYMCPPGEWCKYEAVMAGVGGLGRRNSWLRTYY